jgi:hypothetical protein
LQPNYSHRTIISFYLVLVYSSMIVKPVLPIVSDSLSHAFALAKHLATVHAIYGADHLQQEITETSQGQEKSKTQNQLRPDNPVCLHTLTDLFSYCFHPGQKIIFPSSLAGSITQIFLPFEIPPPRVFFYPLT